MRAVLGLVLALLLVAGACGTGAGGDRAGTGSGSGSGPVPTTATRAADPAPTTEGSTPPTTTAAATSSAPLDPGAPTTAGPVATDPAPITEVPPGPGPGRARVDTLVVAAPRPDLPPYRRDAFGGDWSYDPASGCNTRERVLIEESLVPPVVDGRCRSTRGRWRSAYDGVTVTDVADLQIDHLVPLADAWRSGAAAWTGERRLAFANDLTDPATLVAVTGSTNASKSDSTPDRWLPPDRSSWCAYATDWVTVKATWSLTVTPAEKATLVQLLSGC